MLEIIINIAKVISPIFYKLLYMSIVGSIIGIVILMLEKIFDNKLSARCKCMMWLIPLIFFMIPINRIEIQTNTNVQISSTIDKVEDVFTKVEEKLVDSKEIELTEKIPLGNSSNNLNTFTSNYKIEDIITNVIIPILWLIGSVIGISIFIVGHINLTRKIRSTKRLRDKRLNVILMDCKSKLKINKKMQIRVQKFNQSPCIYGILNPKILVPEEFIKKDEQIVQNVFMHELSHYKRKDMITSFILVLMTILHWFNPISYGFFKRIRNDMELATDEMAMKQMNKEEKKEYGLTLISLLQMYENEKMGTRILCITDDNKNMERRIRKIKLSGKLMKHRILISVFIITILCCMVAPFIVKTSSAVNIKSEKSVGESSFLYKINGNDDEIIDSKNYEARDNIYIKNYNENVTIENVIEVEWIPYKAEYNGEEISLIEIYGTAVIEYGGYLGFYSDNTYVELIGAYSEEAKENYLQGRYEITGENEITLIPNSGDKKILKYVNIDGEAVIIKEIEKNKYVFFRGNLLTNTNVEYEYRETKLKYDQDIEKIYMR